MRIVLPGLVALGLLAISCNSGRNAQSSDEFTPPRVIADAETGDSVGEYTADTMDLGSFDMNGGRPEWFRADDAPYRATYTQLHDLQHVAVRVRFDFATRTMPGEATLTLRPYFYPTDTVVLDAKYMRVEQVALVATNRGKETLTALQFTYPDSLKLVIRLPRAYSRTEPFSLRIRYVAQPEVGAQGGSEAIEGDKGLYFINHDLSQLGKPRQIWTQGETEATSRWVPVIDAPNQKTTSEIWMTVPDTMTTFSNGVLVKSTPAGLPKVDGVGFRTDHWQMTQPHAPYLFAMAAGNFKVTTDKWNGKPVSYYLEPQFHPYARVIFGETPRMLDVYSKLTGVPYPWPNYKQVVVRDFVSGAMENTTATIHYEPVAHDNRSHLDNTHEDIIAHELFHQWFGDYVTTESWSNLALNESFATYGEYLWFEARHGRAAADHHLREDKANYMGEAESKRRPIVDFHYNSREDMFDRHTYQKGGLVLHMLRTHLGDDAFFASLKHYLTKHAYQAAEIHDLRQAFEEVTGQDLNWFFNQWFLQRGHPTLRITYEEQPGVVAVRVEQTQDPQYQPIFRLPTEIAIVEGTGAPRRVKVTVEGADTTFRIPVSGELRWVDFDPNRVILAERTDSNQTLAQRVAIFREGLSFNARIDALATLEGEASDAGVQEALQAATRDAFWGIREAAVGALAGNMELGLEEDVARRLVQIAQEDQKASVRAAAVGVLRLSVQQSRQQNTPLVLPKDELRTVLNRAARDSSYAVAAAGLATLNLLDPDAARLLVDELRNSRSPELRTAASAIILEQGRPEDAAYIQQTIEQAPLGLEKFQLIIGYGQYLQKAPEETRDNGIGFLINIARKDPQWINRMGALRALVLFRDRADVQETIAWMKENEPNQDLRNAIREQL